MIPGEVYHIRTKPRLHTYKPGETNESSVAPIFIMYIVASFRKRIIIKALLLREFLKQNNRT